MVITEDSRFIIVGYEESVKVFDLKTKQQLYHYGGFGFGILLNDVFVQLQSKAELPCFPHAPRKEL